MKRIRSASRGESLRYMIGGNPSDIWEFDVGRCRCKVVNEWRKGAKLFVNDAVVDSNAKTFAVTGSKPLLSAVIEDAGVLRKVEVFVRAILRVKIRVDIDGVPIVGEFI